MTKLKRTEDGGYLIKGKKYETLRGTRRQVHEYETAYKTAGGLLKEDLVQNSKGRIVSKAKFDDGPNLLKNLTKRGFFTKKGKFGHTKMKTRKLRKKLTRKNRRKMKGGATITELKEQLGEVKNIIPNKIDEIKQNPAYKGAVTLVSEDTFEDKLFTPLEELNKTIKGPIDDIETNIDKLENEAKDKLEDAKEELKTKIQENFNIIKDKFKDVYDSAIEEINKILLPGSSMNPLAIAFFKGMDEIKGQLIGMITNKETEIIKQIDELKPDDIADKAVEVATSKSPSSSSNKTSDDKNETPDDNNKTEESATEYIEEMKQTLDPETQQTIEEKLEDVKKELVEAELPPEGAAENLEKQIMNKADIGQGGKKKSKRKK